MPKLTKRTVDSTSPGSAQVLVWDSEVKGFGLRVTPAGAKAYILNYRTGDGRSRRYTIGKHGSPWTCEEARGKAVSLLRDLSAGIDPLEVKTKGKEILTLAELVDLYLSEGPAEKPNKKASSWEADRSNLVRHILPLMGRRPLPSLTSADVSRLQSDIVDGKTAADVKTKARGRAIVTGGKATAARAVAVLAATLEFAVGRKLLTANPAKGVSIVKGEKRERFLVDREVVALAEALAAMEDDRTIHPTMANAIRLLMLTGCRKEEILGLRWQWVDFDRSCLRLPDSKTGAKVVPLAAAAVELLGSLERTSTYVLPSRTSDGPIVGLQKVWGQVKVRATALARQRVAELGEPIERAPDLSGVRLHDLRHSYASFAAADGASLLIIGKVLGHKQASTTAIYAHLHDDPLKAVADRTGARIADALRIGASRERLKSNVIELPKRRAKR